MVRGMVSYIYITKREGAELIFIVIPSLFFEIRFLSVYIVSYLLFQNRFIFLTFFSFFNF